MAIVSLMGKFIELKYLPDNDMCNIFNFLVVLSIVQWKMQDVILDFLNWIEIVINLKIVLFLALIAEKGIWGINFSNFV